MKMTIYCIKDTVKDKFEILFPAETEGQAWREYHKRVSMDEYSKQHTDEFLLFRIGTFHFTTGEFDQQLTEPHALYQSLETEDLIKET